MTQNYYFFWVSCTRTFENPLFSHSQLSQGVSEARLKCPTLQVLYTRAIFLRLSSSDDLVSSTSTPSIVFYISCRVVGQFLLSSFMHPHSQQSLVRGREIGRLGGPGPVRRPCDVRGTGVPPAGGLDIQILLQTDPGIALDGLIGDFIKSPGKETPQKRFMVYE